MVNAYQSALEDYRDRMALMVPEEHREQWLKGFEMSRNYATVMSRNDWFDKGVKAGHGFAKIYHSEVLNLNSQHD